MAAKFAIQVPSDITDTVLLQRFLIKLVDQIAINTEANPKQLAIVDLDQVISATYNQAEVQAISDKLDTVLASLRSANILD